MSHHPASSRAHLAQCALTGARQAAHAAAPTPVAHNAAHGTATPQNSHSYQAQPCTSYCNKSYIVKINILYALYNRSD